MTCWRRIGATVFDVFDALIQISLMDRNVRALEQADETTQSEDGANLESEVVHNDSMASQI